MTITATTSHSKQQPIWSHTSLSLCAAISKGIEKKKNEITLLFSSKRLAGFCFFFFFRCTRYFSMFWMTMTVTERSSRKNASNGARCSMCITRMRLKTNVFAHPDLNSRFMVCICISVYLLVSHVIAWFFLVCYLVVFFYSYSSVVYAFDSANS